MKNPDMLEAFLGQVPEAEREDARQLVHGMRLFALSAQKDLSPKVDLPMLAARSALVGLRSKRLRSCLDLVLTSLLVGEANPKACARFGTWPESEWLPGVGDRTPLPRKRIREAWEHLRSHCPAEVRIPTPGEHDSSVVECLLTLAVQVHMEAPWIRLWRIRFEWIQKGPGCAEKSLKRWWEQHGVDVCPRLRRSVREHRAVFALVAG